MVTRVGGDKCPKPGESKIDTTGAGVWCAPGRGVVLVVGARGGCGFWWWRVGVAVFLLGWGAWARLVVAFLGGGGLG